MSEFAMESRVVVVHADMEPMEGIANPGPHQIYRNPKVSVESRELRALRSDEVRVEMIYGGVCGTDIHLVETNPYTGYIRSSAPAQIPPEGRILGHEGVGKVVEVGPQVRHVKPGDYVTFESIIVCHHCDECRRGDFNQCRHALLLGLEKDGLFGTVVDVPSMLTHDITAFAESGKGLRTAACVEPAGVAYVACQNTKLGAGDVVVIFGAGPIGLFSAMLSKVVFGASRVHMVEPVPFRRTLARKWSDEVYDIDEFFDHGPSSIDVVMEASGHMDNVSRVFRRLNANGRVALLGRSGEPLVLDAVDHMITNAVSLVGSRGHLGGAFAKILSLCQNGRISLDDVVTHVVNGLEGLC
ncbi:MAG: alcohol dehydrogenase catalytic domain-containing protein, partial [Syntrophales bacterium]|nr:alcohol dehydrogenase catalytic domain-containing protein [Syntrophales bacterium]